MKVVGLILHDDKAEAGQELISCPHCGKDFKTEAALKKHVLKDHPDNLDDKE